MLKILKWGKSPFFLNSKLLLFGPVFFSLCLVSVHFIRSYKWQGGIPRAFFTQCSFVSPESAGFGYSDLTCIQGLVPGKVGDLVWDFKKYL